MASFDNNPAAGAGQKKNACGSVEVKITQVVENEALVSSCKLFQEAVANNEFKEFCTSKADSAVSEQDRGVWNLMRVICFEDKAREELLNYLGFNSSSIVEVAADYAKALSDQALPPQSSDSEDWVTGLTSAVGHLSVSDRDKGEIASTTADMVAATVKGEEAEHMIRKALVVGNFAAAVDVCLEAGLMTEALLLAQCGDADLWARTQSEFFSRQKKRKPFLTILQSVIKNELMDYVKQSDLSKWRETLALLSTYGKSEEFNGMCEELARRLEQEAHDIPSATLCYMCATNVERTVQFWAAELQRRNEQKGATDTLALQEFVERVVVYTSAHKVDDLGPICGKIFAEYAGLIASQGILDVAPQYLKGSSDHENILRDRLFHAGPKQVVGARPPPFPFDRVNVAVSSSRAAPGKLPGDASTAANTFSKPAASSASRSNQSRENQRVPQPHQQQATMQPQEQPQHLHHQQQQQQQPQQQQQQAGGDGLPPGWLQLVDPTSNRPYYVDQSTGQSQWEPPSPAPQPQMQSQVPQQQPLPQPQQQKNPVPLQKQQSPKASPVHSRHDDRQQQNSVKESSPAAQSPATSVVPTPDGAAGALQSMLNGIAG